MKPVIPDYDWSIFGVRIITESCKDTNGVNIYTIPKKELD